MSCFWRDSKVRAWRIPEPDGLDQSQPDET
jgi:hypothetical protein